MGISGTSEETMLIHNYSSSMSSSLFIHLYIHTWANFKVFVLSIAVNLRQKLQQQIIPHLGNIDFSSPKLFYLKTL